MAMTSTEASQQQQNARAMEVAKTIIDQIKAQDRWALAAWGAQKFVAVPGYLAADDEVVNNPGIRFHVNGPKTKRGSRVVIALNPMDTYDIVLGHIYSSRWKVDKVVSGVYFDQLVGVLDELIG